MFIGSAGVVGKPSAHMSRVAATVAKASRFPVRSATFQYLTRRSRPSADRQMNFADLPPSATPGRLNLQAMPSPAVASATLYGKTPSGPANRSAGLSGGGACQISAWRRYASRASAAATIAEGLCDCRAGGAPDATAATHSAGTRRERREDTRTMTLRRAHILSRI